MNTIACEQPKVYYLWVVGPGGYHEEVGEIGECELYDMDAACEWANNLATWLTVADFDRRSREVPREARSLRRGLIRVGIDPWDCEVHVVTRANDGDPRAVNGYRPARVVKVETDHRRLLAGA
jgi:hypothetical protein